jgi:GTP-binding protein HflX
MAAVQLPDADDGDFASSMAELRRLATTLGLEVVGAVTQRRGRLAPGLVLGEGKLRELAQWTGGSGEVPAYQKPGTNKRDEDDADDADDADAADAAEPDADAAPGVGPEGPRCAVVLVDHDLSPTQQRNLERATDAEVMDRTSVILSIFHRHAKTREARLQVEIARLAYLAPRLRESGGGGDRVRGGVGGKGAGESSLELDRRRIRDRIAELRRELVTIEGGARTRRARRDDARTIAVVGYTNAGKSSLMRALTGSEVYVADKLFATLDTTVRVLDARTKPPILLSDTVGFIKKLPHDLVASFRSTLDEATHADLLLHVVDASDAAFRDHMAVTRGVLGEIGVDADELIVLNKIDRVGLDERAALAAAFPDAVLMSAKAPADVAALRARLVEHFAGAAVEAELFVPWARHKLVHDIHERCQVVSEAHEEDGTRIAVRAPQAIVDELVAALAAS